MSQIVHLYKDFKKKIKILNPQFRVSILIFQRVLVTLGRHEEALVVAERGRTRAFVDFLLERQKGDSETWQNGLDSTPVTKEHILETIAQQQAAVVYYSLAAGYLYCWLILPDQGNH